MDPNLKFEDRMLQILSTHYHPKQEKILYPFLEEKKEKSLEKSHAKTDDFHILCKDPEKFLEKIHYSWFKEVLEKIPTSFVSFCILSLSKEQQEGLKKQGFTLEKTNKKLSPFAKAYFQEFLWKKAHPSHLLPPAFLPESFFNHLLEKEKTELLEMIDYLGLYDIAEEILQIVDQKSLQTLYSCLSNEKKMFLKQCIQQKDRLSISKIGLEHWNGQKKKLDLAIHRRGLFRFGKALQKEHPDLVWYVLHGFDVGRGKVLQKYMEDKIQDRFLEILKKQVQSVLQFMKKKRTT